MVAKCRSCQADVVFVPSAKSGKQMILDAVPANGVVLVDTGHAMDAASVMVFGNVELGGLTTAARVVKVYTDHHATCPDAESWR